MNSLVARNTSQLVAMAHRGNVNQLDRGMVTDGGCCGHGHAHTEVIDDLSFCDIIVLILIVTIVCLAIYCLVKMLTSLCVKYVRREIEKELTIQQRPTATGEVGVRKV